ncbi:MAG: hypothetical protein VKK04_24295 [Synechococcales bacterium]|nr:hypothetical protein [Synechococcales bacterium]
MIKNDTWIAQSAKKGMIEPFEPSLVRKIPRDGESAALHPVISKIM